MECGCFSDLVAAAESFGTRNTRPGWVGNVRRSGARGGVSEETEVPQVGGEARKCLFL